MKEIEDNKKPYYKTKHDSKELIYMYGKICNMAENTFIGQYKILEYLGKGGFGIVYRCYDSVLKTEVAIKFLDPIITRDHKKFHRIKREINISRKITDDRIVKIYSMEKYYDVIFLVMEFIDGVPLSEVIKTKSYEWDDFKPILIEILQGLRLLHKNGIIHRDLKPGNIMVLKNGSIKIVDFGLAKEIADNEKTSATEEFSGTAEFVSPEQVQGGDLDARSDIYQVGLVIFKVLADSHPLSSSSTMELLVKYLTVNPRKISAFKKNLPDYAKFLIGKMLERKKVNRFNNVEEIIKILESETVKLSTQMIFLTRKNKIKLIIFGLVLIIISIIIFFNTYDSKKINKVIESRNELIAKNRFSRVLWKNNFAPDTIIKSFMMPVTPESGNLNTKGEKNVILCLLENSSDKVLRADSSINTIESDSKVVVIKTDGTIISKNSFIDYFNLQHYDYDKIFNVSGNIVNKDLNKDGEKDILFKVGNGLGMYPYGLVYFKDNIPLVYTSPGIFKYKIISSDENTLTFTVFGTANLVSGLSFFSEINLKDEYVHGIPNLSKTCNQNFDGYTFYLPSNLKIVSNKWNKNGIVKFVNIKTGNKVYISKDYKISVIKNSIEKTYFDPPSKIKMFNILFNTFYKEKILYKDYTKAENLINEIIRLKFENPFLKSALYCLKGDIEIKNGDYKKGELSLEKGLAFYQENPRIAGILSFIPFFKGDPLGALEIQERLFSNYENFDGISNGTNIFRVFMYLSSGLITKAEEFTAKVIQNSPEMRYSLLPLISFFNGKLDDAEKIIELGLKRKRAEIGNAPYRLLCSKIYILNNSNIDRARFFLEDVLKYSVRFGHLSELSLAYLLAKDDKINEAGKMADLSLIKILKYAKGDFPTKAWLFYEYYIYGRTMELVGNKEKAIKGYQNCIATTPNSYLSKLATLRLSVLK